MSYFAKYDVPAPRYTSYPTVPYWTGAPSKELWLSSIRKGLADKDATWSLYLHLPFCESLCTFCGCHKIITKNHDLASSYIKTIGEEFQIYLREVPELKQRPLKAIHLGGGTPTFFTARELESIAGPMLKAISRADDLEGSIEVDPRRATKDQLEALRNLGFNRISLGVQDFTEEVQKLINRIQSVEITQRVFDWARQADYSSINLDLIFGLPGQTLQHIESTVAATIAMAPDRIALYSFALVPWLKPQQRIFRDEDIPVGKAKRDLYERAREMLMDARYEEIGMDHFARPQDPLAIAKREGRLHRNFMGYTDQQSTILLGLGLSSISESPDCFHQNEKLLPQYEKAIASGALPTHSGHVLSAEDKFQRSQILQLMTDGSTVLKPDQVSDVQHFLAEMVQDGLVKIESKTLSITEAGRPFLRNACMALDLRMRAKNLGAKVFSQSV
jgi:oxygen-independent coproporphyrinogen-3 oxidase